MQPWCVARLRHASVSRAENTKTCLDGGFLQSPLWFLALLSHAMDVHYATASFPGLIFKSRVTQAGVGTNDPGEASCNGASRRGFGCHRSQSASFARRPSPA